jgi:dihydroxyacid dehydratase/phosphogluconate dehydratase
VLDLAKTVKDAVKKQGMLGWQYNTIGVSDAITMGGEGKYIPSRAKTCETPTFRMLIHA